MTEANDVVRADRLPTVPILQQQVNIRPRLNSTGTQDLSGTTAQFMGWWRCDASCAVSDRFGAIITIRPGFFRIHWAMAGYKLTPLFTGVDGITTVRPALDLGTMLDAHTTGTLVRCAVEIGWREIQGVAGA